MCESRKAACVGLKLSLSCFGHRLFILYFLSRLDWKWEVQCRTAAVTLNLYYLTPFILIFSSVCVTCMLWAFHQSKVSPMALHIPGLIMMVVFYILVLGIGIWASVKSKKMEKNTLNGQIEVSFLANRRVSLAVGVFTMTGGFWSNRYIKFLSCMVCSIGLLLKRGVCKLVGHFLCAKLKNSFWTVFVSTTITINNAPEYLKDMTNIFMCVYFLWQPRGSEVPSSLELQSLFMTPQRAWSGLFFHYKCQFPLLLVRSSWNGI